MKVIHILADNRQVDDISNIKVDLSNIVYTVCKSLEAKEDTDSEKS